MCFVYFFSEQTNKTNTVIRHAANKTNELVAALETLDAHRIHLLERLEEKEKEFNIHMQNNQKQLDSLSEQIKKIEQNFDLVDDNSHVDVDSIAKRLDALRLNALVRTVFLQKVPNGSPIEYYSHSSGYGSRTHPVTGDEQFHLGLDLTAEIGTPVYATADGVIEYLRPSRSKGYGNLLKVSHGLGFMTLYAHLDEFNVESGQFVQKGQLIAWSGNTGLSTGPHLHYEVRFLGKALNPNHFIHWGIANFETLFEQEKRVKWEELGEMIKASLIPQIKLTTQDSPDATRIPKKANIVATAQD